MESNQSVSLPALRERVGTSVKVGFMDSAGFDLMQRVAKALASSNLVPPQYQNNLPNCLIALEMANRVGASPLQICQNLYVVQGRPSWSAKFLIATFNQCGRFSAIRYEWQGEKGKKDWGCRAWAIEKATGERVQSAWITWELVEAEGWNKKSGSKWLTMPEQMFMYRAAAWLVNTHAPEISMGLNTAEEIHDVIEAERTTDGTFAPVETVKERVEVATTTPAQEEKVIQAEVVTEEPTPPVDNPADKYPDIVSELSKCQTISDLVRYMNHLPAKLKKELHGVLEHRQAELREAAAKTMAESEGTSLD